MLKSILITIVSITIAAAAIPAAAEPLHDGLPSQEELADNNELFLSLARKALKWEEPAEPTRIAGPLYFVGTEGLGVFLFTTSEGHILMNTGMPSSGPMIEDSIRKLGFAPEDIKVMINGHAHIDHAGAFAYLKDKYGAELAVMLEDVPAMESGDKNDFKYADDFVYPAVKVDRILRDGDTIKLGDIVMTAYLTPGHTRGATTWVADLALDGRSVVVTFPDGAGFNPGYRLTKNPSYPGIAEDYRRTHHFLEMLEPDIWLAQHNEYYDLNAKRERAKTEGLDAWIDPEGYRRFVAGKKRAFEDQVDIEMGVAQATAGASKTSVTVETFIRAETDSYFRNMEFGKLRHSRTMASIDEQDVVRMNRDTLYSSGVFDLDAAPVTVELPDPGSRFMSLQVISQDHYTTEVSYAPGTYTYSRDKVGTRYVFLIIRTLANPEDPADLAQANALQDAIVVN